LKKALDHKNRLLGYDKNFTKRRRSLTMNPTISRPTIGGCRQSNVNKQARKTKISETNDSHRDAIKSSPSISRDEGW